jgi:hypothetical protein
MYEPLSFFAPKISRGGLNVQVSPGTVYVNGALTVFSNATNLALAQNKTNFVFLDLTGPVILAVNQTGFPLTNCYPIATVVTGVSEVQSLTDNRPDIAIGAQGGGTVTGTGATTDVAYWTGTSTIGGNFRFTFDPATLTYGLDTGASGLIQMLANSQAEQLTMQTGSIVLNTQQINLNATTGVSLAAGAAAALQFPTTTAPANTLFSSNGASPQVGSWTTGLTWNPSTRSLSATGTTSTHSISSNTNDALTIGPTSVTLTASNATAQLTLGSATLTDVDSNTLVRLGFTSGAVQVGGTGSATGSLNFKGLSSGTANLGVAAVAGTPNPIQLPTTTGTAGGLWTTNGANPQVTSWTSSLLYAAPTLTLSAAGAGNGALALSGNTSGTATFTAPAVAGTTTNQIAVSNVLGGPAGSAAAPTYSFSTQPGTGLYLVAGNSNPRLARQGADIVEIASAGLNVNNGFVVTFAGAGGFTTLDTGLSRSAAGTLAVGNGTASDVSGTVSAAHFTGGGNAGVTAGPFSSVTSITSTGGIVTTLTGTSDASLKTDIHPFVRGLDAVMNLHPATYRWNERGQEITKFGPNVEQAGFIAQDVEQAIPEAIGSESHNGTKYLTISDRPIIAALVNALQEQQQEIARLWKEIAALKAHS